MAWDRGPDAHVPTPNRVYAGLAAGRSAWPSALYYELLVIYFW